MHKIIAIVGMCGSGKSKVTEFFVSKNWNYVYFGGVTIEKLKQLGMEITEQNERNIREELRKEYGPAAYAIMLAEKIAKCAEEKNTVLDGLYSWHEYVYLKEKFGNNLEVLAIVTNREIRYERLENRDVRPLSFQDAQQRDYAEIEKLAKGGPISIADYYIMNNTTEEELFSQVQRYIEQMGGCYET